MSEVDMIRARLHRISDKPRGRPLPLKAREIPAEFARTEEGTLRAELMERFGISRRTVVRWRMFLRTGTARIVGGGEDTT